MDCDHRMARYRVTVDTGGTFSDFVYLDEATGELSIAKVPSTPDDPSRAILAGIKISAVINVGTATIAAFIGAGGYGERIASGLALNDNVTLLAGAVPAAVLALLVQGAFELGERRFGWMARARGQPR